MKVGFIGAGNIAKAIILGLSKNKVEYTINICDHNQEKLDELGPLVDFSSLDASDVIAASDYIILSIKPDIYKKFLDEHHCYLKDKIVVSIAPGVRSEFMRQYTTRYILAMPNTPAILGLGLTAMVRNGALTDEEFRLTMQIFKSVGEVLVVEEDELDLMITVAASAPAYFGLVIDAMVKYAMGRGMDSKKAYYIIAQVMNATSQMHMDLDERNARALVDKVCSKNGTTIRAVNYFDENGLDGLFAEAMERCFQRAVEMREERMR